MVINSKLKMWKCNKYMWNTTDKYLSQFPTATLINNNVICSIVQDVLTFSNNTIWTAKVLDKKKNHGPNTYGLVDKYRHTSLGVLFTACSIQLGGLTIWKCNAWFTVYFSIFSFVTHLWFCVHLWLHSWKPYWLFLKCKWVVWQPIMTLEFTLVD